MKTIACLLGLAFSSLSLAQEVVPFKNADDLYGLKVKDGETIVQAKYHQIRYSKENGWFVYTEKVNGFRKEGIINEKGEILLPADDRRIGQFKNGYSIIQVAVKEDKMIYVQKYQYGLMNTDFEFVIEPEYQKIEKPSKKGSYIVIKNDKWGLMNTKGEVLIDFIYDQLITTAYTDFDYLITKKNEKHGLIDVSGNTLIEARFDQTASEIIHNGWCVSLDNKWGIVDIKGKEIIPFKYDEIKVINKTDHTPDGSIYAKARSGKLFGAIDKSGHEIVPFEYEEIGYLREDYIDVKKDGRYGFIDVQGHVKIKPIYKEVLQFNGALAAARIKKKWGYINNQGNWAIEPQFDDARSFVNASARVRIGKEDFYIDPTGKRLSK